MCPCSAAKNILTASESTELTPAEIEDGEKKIEETLALDDYYAIRASVPVRFYSIHLMFPRQEG